MPVSVPLVGESVVSSSSLFVGLNYQLDLWGKNAAATRGLLSMRDAARVEAEQARLTLSVAIVTLYGELDRAYALRELLQQKRRASEQVEAVLRERAARGIDNGYDANDAALKRGKLLEQIALTDEQIQLQKLQLGVLSGRGPSAGCRSRGRSSRRSRTRRCPRGCRPSCWGGGRTSSRRDCGWRRRTRRSTARARRSTRT
ncbi:efflux transporter, outer membrane factor lipoprotein, NodT family [Burkholderia pseudomallei]|nr:efflux transporter, outer membrane factor lipoprotein, NodT family [Burkholderia pseudomallei]